MKEQLMIPSNNAASPAGRKFSLKRQIIRAGWLFILVITLLLLALQINFINAYRSNGEEKRANDMYAYGQTLETHLAQLLDAVRTIYSENHAFEEIGAYRSPAEKYNDVYELLNTLRVQVNSNKAIEGLFVYYDSFGQVQYALNEGWSFSDIQKVKELGKTTLESSENVYNTVLFETDDNLLYGVFMKKNTAALGGCISLSQGLPDEKDETAVYGVIDDGRFYPAWAGQAEKPADDRPYIVNSTGTVVNHRIDFTIELMKEVEGVDGYHFQFLDDSMQKVIKNKNVKASNGGKYKFSSCPETMYVRARAWTQENGKKVFSEWSNMEHLYCYVGGETAVIKSAEGRKNQVVLNFVPLQFSDGFDCKLIGRSPGAPGYAMKNQRSNQIVFKNVEPGIYAAKGRAYRIVNGKKNYGNRSNIVKVVVE